MSGFQNHGSITDADYNFLAAQERNHVLLTRSFDLTHLENALKRLGKEAKRLQDKSLDAGHKEAAECLRTAQAAIEDAREAMK